MDFVDFASSETSSLRDFVSMMHMLFAFVFTAVKDSIGGQATFEHNNRK
jgi:hypothetical protein